MDRKDKLNVLLLLNPDHWSWAKCFQKFANTCLLYPKHSSCELTYKIHRIPGKVRSLCKVQTKKPFKLLGNIFNPPHNVEYCHDPEKIDMIFVFDPVVCNFNFQKFKNAIKAYWIQDSIYPSAYYNYFYSIGLENYDQIFVAHKNYIKDYSKYTNRVFWLPYAYDPDVYHPMKVEEKYDVSFVGTMDARRRKVIDAIHSNFPALRVMVGEFWNHDANFIYNSSKIVFNLTRQNELNWRTFEVLGSGSFLLNSLSNEVLDLFSDGKDLVMFNDNES
ncbi:MAG: glycosyltransferase [Candidatus Parvarchaeota archaeon]